MRQGLGANFCSRISPFVPEWAIAVRLRFACHTTMRHSGHRPPWSGVRMPPESTSERFSVTFHPCGIAALARLQALTDRSKMDVINRSLEVYALVEQHAADGHALAFVDEKGKIVDRVTIL